MTSQAENDLLAQVGPSTPMGALMRQYWLPAFLSSELAADNEPLRLVLLGERLIAFLKAMEFTAITRRVGEICGVDPSGVEIYHGAMSDQQKKNADQVFQTSGHGTAASKS